MSSHLLSEVVRSADDVVVLCDGALRAAGPLARVLGPVTRDALEQLAGLEDAFLTLTGAPR